ncbi:Uncharacterized conserved protein YjiS, DUF1127 family [Gemmobacter aquatilis]|uniref:Uncharacterized conserved protein YjiS, DUF1127 family n=1 Tax=Gemmobacter aquatilis TaxID=933059 RepID=A0A1H8GN70_9RHOB|nr:DUF1127 domain-containing protein [Gemmobacter aquatilis]SEN45416.1 Uncharacterized conserved protein YjiS, DUF1127 family [Gemmobacter aquatilis]
MARSQLTAPSLILSNVQPLPPVSRIVIALAQTVLTWDLRRHGRRALRNLDPHLLRDIGLTEQAAAVEAEKPFWQD